MSRRHHEHPAALLAHLGVYVWLVPLLWLRRLPAAPWLGALPSWLRDSRLDWALAGVLLSGAVLLWWRRTYTVSPHCLCVSRGVLVRRTTQLPILRITTLTVERPLWLRLVGGARVVADTDAGHHRMADLRLTVKRAHIPLFLPDERRVRFRAGAGRIGLLAVLACDSFGGVLLIASLFRHGSVLLGEGWRRTLLANLESAADTLARIPRTAALLTILLLAGWLVGTLRVFLRHLPFAVCRRADTLSVYTGFFTRRVHCCALDAVNYCDRRQTLATHLLRLHTVYISCTGYGKDRNTQAVLVPPCRHRRAQQELALFLPAMARHTLSLHPARGALWRYLRLPLCLLAGLPAAHAVLADCFAPWRALITYLTVLTVFPCLWLLAVRLVTCRTAGLGYDGGCVCLSYARRLTLHRVTLPRDKIVAVHIRQSLWQKRRGTCDIRFYSHHEFRRPHPVRQLPAEAVAAWLSDFDKR